MKSLNPTGKKFEFEKEFIKSPEAIGPLVLHQLGELFCEPGYQCEPHNQWCHEISYVVSGEGLSIIDGIEIPVKQGDVFLTPINCFHIIKATSEFRYLFIGFDFSLSAGDEYNSLRAFYKTSPTNIIKGKQEVVSTFNKCLDEYYNSLPSHKLMIQSYMMQLLIHVARLFTVTKNIRYLADNTVNYVGLSLYSVILFIDTNIHTIRDVNTIAKSLGYNPCYLSHIFKKQMGVTLQQYLCNKRVEESIRLIKQNGISISEASYLLGFSTPQAYSRAFKRVKGMSPSKYLESQT